MPYVNPRPRYRLPKILRTNRKKNKKHLTYWHVGIKIKHYWYIKCNYQLNWVGRRVELSAVTRKTRIIDVLYNASNNELVRTKTLVKNCVISIDCTPFRTWYEAHYALPLGKKKGAKLVRIVRCSSVYTVVQKASHHTRGSSINDFYNSFIADKRIILQQSPSPY